MSVVAIPLVAKQYMRCGSRPLISALALYPGWAGWASRVALVAWAVVDRVIRDQRVSLEEIRSLSQLDSYAVFQVVATFGVALTLCMKGSASFSILRTYLIRSPLSWIAAYYIVATASAAWSGAALLTLFKSIQGVTFLAAVIVSVAGVPTFVFRVRLMVAISIYYIVSCYASFFAVKYPETSLNVVALHFIVSSAPFLGVLFLVLNDYQRWVKRYYWALVLPILAAETVLTNYLAFAMAVGVLVFLRSSLRMRLVLPALAIFVTTLVIVTFPDNPNELFLGIKSVAEISSGTGRFEVWDYAVRTAFWVKPVLGYGFAVGDAIGRTSGINAALSQLHNAHLSALLNLGIVGAALWELFMVSLIIAIIRIRDRSVRIALVCAFVVTCIHQVAGGASLSSILHIVWIADAFLFVLIAVEFREQQIKASWRYDDH